MADTRLLLNGLVEYRASLARHLQELRDEFQALELRWGAFSTVYDGDAAQEFKEHWARTTSNFAEYLERTTHISRILDERIDALREANRPDGVLG